jgi:hypothetical protein
MRGEAEIRVQRDMYRADCEWGHAEAKNARERGHDSLASACEMLAEQSRERLCMLGWVLGERTTPSPWLG